VFISLMCLIVTSVTSGFRASQLKAFVYAATAADLVAAGMFLLGWWWLTRPDAGQLTTNRGERPRQHIRIAVTLLVFTKLTLTMLPVASNLPAHIVTLIRAVDRLTLCIGLVAGMRYLQWLAARLPSESVQKRATTLFKALLVTASLFAIYYTAQFISMLGLNLGAESMEAKLLRIAVRGGKAFSGWASMYCFFVICSLFNQLRKELRRIRDAQQGPPPAVSGGPATPETAC
jgi:hypothetical protein